MSENKFCTNCGAALREGVQFCTECGTKVAGDVTPVTQSTPITQSVPVGNVNQGVQQVPNQVQPEFSQTYSPIPNENQKVKNDKQGKVILGVFGLLAVLAIAFFIYIGFSSYPKDPGKVAEKCYKAILVDFDAKKAEKYLAFGGAAVEGVQKRCDEFKDTGAKIKKIEAIDTDEVGESVEVTLRITVSWLGETETDEYKVLLMDMGGKWKVYDFSK